MTRRDGVLGKGMATGPPGRWTLLLHQEPCMIGLCLMVERMRSPLSFDMAGCLAARRMTDAAFALDDPTWPCTDTGAS